ncbi:DgyrCDS2074 [Dimorphilus gyrociliatus]|uniref:DgyrCDS2074 n=1 Tax=Dimorphilus gyrociliatus TaxID=2664684 RepID=A0A7I8VB52_9ANNE|nr:DgyrCDS2074 [Dimorphilus gyrociliatus]
MSQNRYALLLRPDAYVDELGEGSQEYAAFLRDKERKCGASGFVDSKSAQQSYQLRKKSKTAEPAKSKTREKEPKEPRSASVIDVRNQFLKDQKQFDKQIKVIEDHMWQHKQEERELKRSEGDIIKNQRQVRKSLRDFEMAINRKKLSEEKKLNQGLEKYTKFQREYVHQKENTNRQRIQQTINMDQQKNACQRKMLNTSTNLARQYRTKLEELEAKRMQIEHINEQYTDKLRQSEEEQNRLKRELGELAISLNMEAQKGKTKVLEYKYETVKEKTKRLNDDKVRNEEIENKLGKSDVDSKAAERSKRKLSAELSLTRAHLQLKQREEGRHKQDTETRLKNNATEQKQLSEMAANVELEMKSRQIDKKIIDINNRKKEKLEKDLTEKKEKSQNHEEIFNSKFQKRNADHRVKIHEDHLKHFQKSVNKGEEIEQELYQRVRDAEYKRQKQDQEVKKLQTTMADIKKKNALRLQRAMAENEREERELEQKLIREQALLNKLHTDREANYGILISHRDRLREEKYLLEEHDREHNRLLRISLRTDALQTE